MLRCLEGTIKLNITLLIASSHSALQERFGERFLDFSMDHREVILLKGFCSNHGPVNKPHQAPCMCHLLPNFLHCGSGSISFVEYSRCCRVICFLKVGASFSFIYFFLFFFPSPWVLCRIMPCGFPWKHENLVAWWLSLAEVFEFEGSWTCCVNFIETW